MILLIRLYISSHNYFLSWLNQPSYVPNAPKGSWESWRTFIFCCRTFQINEPNCTLICGGTGNVKPFVNVPAWHWENRGFNWITQWCEAPPPSHCSSLDKASKFTVTLTSRPSFRPLSVSPERWSRFRVVWQSSRKPPAFDWTSQNVSPSPQEPNTGFYSAACSVVLWMATVHQFNHQLIDDLICHLKLFDTINVFETVIVCVSVEHIDHRQCPLSATAAGPSGAVEESSQGKGFQAESENSDCVLKIVCQLIIEHAEKRKDKKHIHFSYTRLFFTNVYRSAAAI